MSLPSAQPPRSRPSLWALWISFRNRMLGSARFQRFAARFPLFRGVARRRATALFDLCAGFVYSQVLQAVVRLRLLEQLADGPRTAGDLQPAMGLPPDGARRLLDAAASLRLLERRGEHYGLGIHGAALLGNPGVYSMIEHHEILYRDLADPLALLRGEVAQTGLSRFWSYSRSRDPASSSDDNVAGYSTLMSRSLALLVEDLLEAYPFARHHRLLDVAGGEGTLVRELARSFPSLQLSLFDLPAVAARARDRLAQAGLAGRVEVVGGDLHRDALPGGFDLATLVRIVHDHDDAQARSILVAVRRALVPGGVLLVAEPMAGTAGAEPMGDAYFGFYLMAMGQGRPRTLDELAGLLREAGFAQVRPLRTRRPMLARVLLATNP